MQNRKASVYIALFTLLLIAVAINILPLIAIIPLNGQEHNILNAVNAMKGSSIDTIFKDATSVDLAENIYAYIVRLFLDFDETNIAFWLRLPSAIITGILTLCLFRFDGTFEKLRNSFVASLVFMSCVYVSILYFQASPILLPGVLTIVSLVSLYHWLRRPTRKKALLLTISIAANLIMVGMIASIIILVIGGIFLATTKIGKLRNWITLVLSLINSLIIAYIAVFIITGDRNLTIDIVCNFSTFASQLNNNISTTAAFFMNVVVALIPTSIPLLLSIPWAIKNYRKVYEKFLNLNLLNRFGIIVFLISIPSFWFYSQFSSVLLLASVFFNSPLIGRILIFQFTHLDRAWRITGIIIGVLAAIGTTLYIILNNGITIMGISLTSCGWETWNIILVIFIFISVYSLSRNDREIKRNNRYFFNIIILYLLVQNLTVGYILPYISY